MNALTDKEKATFRKLANTTCEELLDSTRDVLEVTEDRLKQTAASSIGIGAMEASVALLLQAAISPEEVHDIFDSVLLKISEQLDKELEALEKSTVN